MNTGHAATPPSLIDLLGPASAEFLATTWGRKPLHVPGADPQGFDWMVSLSRVDEILSCSSTRPPYVRVFKDGGLVDTEAYTYSTTVARTRVTGLLDPGRLMGLFDDGATIVLDSINHWVPECRELCDALQRELGGDGRATAFITPPHGCVFLRDECSGAFQVMRRRG